MEKIPKELLKEYVNIQNFTSTTDIMEALKEMFKDALQQVMNSKLDEKLGYEKSERESKNDEASMSKNYRNGYSPKQLKLKSDKLVNSSWRIIHFSRNL